MKMTDWREGEPSKKAFILRKLTAVPALNTEVTAVQGPYLKNFTD